MGRALRGVNRAKSPLEGAAKAGHEGRRLSRSPTPGVPPENDTVEYRKIRTVLWMEED